MRPMDEGIGERYLRETRHSRGHLVGGRMDWARRRWKSGAAA
jgi:hypothetical protein